MTIDTTKLDVIRDGVGKEGVSTTNQCCRVNSIDIELVYERSAVSEISQVQESPQSSSDGGKSLSNEMTVRQNGSPVGTGNVVD